MGKCFHCGAEAGEDVPALIPYCKQCWDDEHPNVRARLAGDAAQLGRTGDGQDLPQ
jgi:hypothetical protein